MCTWHIEGVEGVSPLRLLDRVTKTRTAAQSADTTSRFGLADVAPRELCNLAPGGA